MKNLNYGSTKVIKECANRVRKDQHLCDGMQVEAQDGSIIYIENGVFCYNYTFNASHSLDVCSFLNSLIMQDGEDQGIALFRDERNTVTLNSELVGGGSSRTNMFDVADAYDRIMDEIADALPLLQFHQQGLVDEAWDMMNDLQLYLDDTLHSKSYADAKIVGFQMMTAIFNTVYEYAESGLAVMVNCYGDITLPDVETFMIIFCDHVRHIMTSTFCGDNYGVSK